MDKLLNSKRSAPPAICSLTEDCLVYCRTLVRRWVVRRVVQVARVVLVDRVGPEVLVVQVDLAAILVPLKDGATLINSGIKDLLMIPVSN